MHCLFEDVHNSDIIPFAEGTILNAVLSQTCFGCVLTTDKSR
jgi:hypothetical protein